MAIVGAFARVDSGQGSLCRERLCELAGVSTFEIDDPDKVGILIEADSLDQAHAMVSKTIRLTPGVLGVWPVYVNTEDEQEQD